MSHTHGPTIRARFLHKLVKSQPARKFSVLPQKPQKPAMRVETETAGHPQVRRHSGINRSLPI